MKQKSGSILWLLFCVASAPLIHSQEQTAPKRDTVCNQDSTLCVKAAVEKSVVQNPLYFEVEVMCPDPVELGWELRDDAGQTLAQDPDGSLAFRVSKTTAAQRTLAVRDFGLLPAKTSHGTLVLHATAFSASGQNHTLPELSIPVQLDLRTTTVTYAVQANVNAFSQAVDNTVESDPAHPVPMQAEIQWRTKTVLYAPPSMLGGAAAEAAALADSGQGPWHVANYAEVQDTAHITVLGQGWAGVSYYLTGLDYLLQKTAEHQPGVRHVVFDTSPEPGQ